MMDNDPVTEAVNRITEAREKAPEDAGAGQQPEKETELAVCPCCGKPTLKKPVVPKGELMDHFMSCMVTGVPYSNTYDLYNGKMHIRITQPTDECRTRLEAACTQLESIRDRLPGSAAEISALLQSLRIYACCDRISVDVADGKTFLPSRAVSDCLDSLETLRSGAASGELDDGELSAGIRKCWKLLKDPAMVSALPASTLMSLEQLHNYVYSLLMDAGFDENFWGRIKLA